MHSQADKERFLDIIGQNKRLIYKVANSYCRDAEDRKDLVQEIIIQLWRSFGRYDERYKLSTWMYRIALNTAISHYRRDRNRQASNVPLHEDLLELANDDSGLIADERVKQLYEFIGQLDELNRALMILYLDDNSYRDISEVLGISETNVATKISRIKNHLKKQFEKI